eukprot:79858-Prorocentrum_minimum.AAC.4
MADSIYKNILVRTMQTYDTERPEVMVYYHMVNKYEDCSLRSAVENSGCFTVASSPWRPPSPSLPLAAYSKSRFPPCPIAVIGLIPLDRGRRLFSFAVVNACGIMDAVNPVNPNVCLAVSRLSLSQSSSSAL